MDSSNRESLPVSYIRQFCFCPRIPFLSVFLEIKPPPPLWVQDGVDFHEKAAMLQKRRKLSKFNLSGKGVFKSNIYLKSSVYPIHGIADGIFIMEDGEIVPLEFKAQDNFVASRGHILQLTGYAILLEEKFQKEVSRGFILYGRKGKTLGVEFTEE
ncbi:CRISPR-associated protein Cas4 [Parasutterella sp.]|nr:CRISPR-associated protein Cas4 [Parasutterella sp.]